MITIRIDKIKRCAFCKHWYDPTNSHIEPHVPRHNLWNFDPKAKCKCMISNLERPGDSSCGKYECKL